MQTKTEWPRGQAPRAAILFYFPLSADILIAYQQIADQVCRDDKIHNTHIPGRHLVLVERYHKLVVGIDIKVLLRRNVLEQLGALARVYALHPVNLIRVGFVPVDHLLTNVLADDPDILFIPEQAGQSDQYLILFVDGVVFHRGRGRADRVDNIAANRKNGVVVAFYLVAAGKQPESEIFRGKQKAV